MPLQRFLQERRLSIVTGIAGNESEDSPKSGCEESPRTTSKWQRSSLSQLHQSFSRENIVRIRRREQRMKKRSSHRVLDPSRYATVKLGPPNMYVTLRDGQILGRGTVLKTDQFPAKEKRQLDLHISGAPNFRQAPFVPVYGVGQPCVYGVRTILNLLRMRPFHRGKTVAGGRQAVWINLREEPVIYVNHRPFVLREFEHPFRNLYEDFQGVDYKGIQHVERRLKWDLLREAKRSHMNVLVHDEHRLGEVRACWEAASKHALQTSHEMFDQLKKEGYRVSYFRVPCTAECAFNSKDFDRIADVFARFMQTCPEDPSLLPGDNVFFIFNCQRGVGRSTMAMCIVFLLRACLLQLDLLQPALLEAAAQQRELGRGAEAPAKRTVARRELQEEMRHLHRSEFQMIQRLLRLLSFGHTILREVDVAVDLCGRVHNLFDSIIEARARSRLERQADREVMFSGRGIERLQRYCYLVLFQAYLKTVSPADLRDRARLKKKTFSMWLKERPGLVNVVNQSCEESLHPQRVPRQELSETQRFVQDRRGNVLGKDTIVAFDVVFKRPRHVPFFFKTIGKFRVGAAAQPPLSGIRTLLWQLLTKSTTSRVVWISLREEPVVYIGNQSFTLRMFDHPFRTPLEFRSGMTAKRTAGIEARFKADILEEAKENDGRLLVHDPASENGGRWINVVAEEVLTVSEVFEMLKTENFNVQFERVPITLGDSPQSQSFDHLLKHINDTLFPAEEEKEAEEEGKKPFFVFNCQRGGRRSTMAAVVTSLFALHHFALHHFVLPVWTREDLPQSLLPLPKPNVRKLSDVDEEAEYSENSAQSADIVRRGSSELEQVTMIRRKSCDSITASELSMLRQQQHEENEQEETELAHSDEEGEMEEPPHAHARRGEYKGILGLIRVLPNGALVKEQVDFAIDICGGNKGYHLREAIDKARMEAEASWREPQHSQKAAGPQHLKLRAGKYLQTYAYLILVNAYLHYMFAPANRNDGGLNTLPIVRTTTLPSNAPFSAWLQSRPELVRWLENMSDRIDDLLQVYTFSTNDEYASVYEARAGSVLTRGSILKSDFFVGCRSEQFDPFLSGAINFRGLDHFPVAGTGMPTSEGIFNVLRHMVFQRCNCSVSNSPDYRGQPFPRVACVWLNLREEPVVFVRGSPYVLRDFHTPYVNLENTGIKTRRVELMEAQLKEDVLAEAQRLGGKFLLHDEDEDGNLTPIVINNIRREEVKTTHEMYTDVFRQLLPSWVEKGCELLQEQAKVHMPSPSPSHRQAGSCQLFPDAVEAEEHKLITHLSHPNPVTTVPTWMAQAQEKEGQLRPPAPSPPLVFSRLGSEHHVREEKRLMTPPISLMHGAGGKSPRGHRHGMHNRPLRAHESGDSESEMSVASAKSDFEVIALYYRTPITDEQAPSPATFDVFVRHLESCGKLFGPTTPLKADAACAHSAECAVRPAEAKCNTDNPISQPRFFFILNCQMGRGRTTTGMIIAALWCLHRGLCWTTAEKLLESGEPKKKRQTRPHSPSAHRTSIKAPVLDVPDAEGSIASMSLEDTIDDSASATEPGQPRIKSRGEQLRKRITREAQMKGEYKVVQRLVRFIRDGMRIKEEVDRVIDHCDSMQNLRTSVLDMKKRTEAHSHLRTRLPALIERGANYLRRYLLLIVYNAYFHDQKRKNFALSFQNWYDARPELKEIVSSAEFPP